MSFQIAGAGISAAGIGTSSSWPGKSSSGVFRYAFPGHSASLVPPSIGQVPSAPIADSLSRVESAAQETPSGHVWPTCEQAPGSVEVGPARLGDLVEHADHLVGVVWAGIGERCGCLLVSEVRVLLKKEPPPVSNVGGVNDRLQSDPVEGTAKEHPGCGYDLAERL